LQLASISAASGIVVEGNTWMIVDSCSNCKFFFPNEYPGYGLGGCRRFPPVQFTIMPGNLTQTQRILPHHTPVQENDWCGEWIASIAGAQTVLDYLFNSATGSTTSPKQVRQDNTAATLTHNLFFNTRDNSSTDQTAFLQSIPLNTTIHIEDASNAGIWQNFNVTGVIVIGSSTATVPVGWLASGQALVSGSVCHVTFTFPPTST
jgi:hypothetical protein